MQPVLALVLAAALAVAVPGPGRSEAGQEGTRAAPGPAQDSRGGGAARPGARGTEGDGWLGLTGRFLDFFSDERPPTTERGCAVGSCPSGMQCCCCGDECYCKRECSLQRCK